MKDNLLAFKNLASAMTGGAYSPEEIEGDTIAEVTNFAAENYVGGSGGTIVEAKIKSVSVNGSKIDPDDEKNVDITVPTKVSELDNDSKFVDETVIGDMSALKTTDKTSLVNAVNELTGSNSGSGLEIANNAGAHNSIYRGKDLGTSVTDAQYAAIAAGTFEDLFVGDYWTIDGIVWRIAHFDYWLNTGDTECTKHHAVIVPDSNLYTANMNDTNITTGAYVGSKMYTKNLNEAKTTIRNAFGTANILTHREYLANATKATADPTYESAGSWYDSTVELMNECMVYGSNIFHNVQANGVIPVNYTIDKSQLALFRLDPSRICNRAYWWLRDVVSAASFAIITNYGHASSASAAFGVRPAFGITA